MSTDIATVRGTLRPDGTLELEHRPDLPAGPVEVTIRVFPAETAAGETWWQFMKRRWDARQAAGASALDDREVEALERELRHEEDRIDVLDREMGSEGSRAQQNPGTVD